MPHAREVGRPTEKRPFMWCRPGPREARAGASVDRAGVPDKRRLSRLDTVGTPSGLRRMKSARLCPSRLRRALAVVGIGSGACGGSSRVERFGPEDVDDRSAGCGAPEGGEPCGRSRESDHNDERPKHTAGAVGRRRVVWSDRGHGRSVINSGGWGTHRLGSLVPYGGRVSAPSTASWPIPERFVRPRAPPPSPMGTPESASSRTSPAARRVRARDVPAPHAARRDVPRGCGVRR